MDPLSISSAVGGLVTVCGQIITTSRAIVNSLQNAPRILSAIQVECSTTREALSQIFTLINKSDTTAFDHLSSNALLSQSFDIALTGCTVTFSVLDNELDKILKHSEGVGDLGFHQKAKVVWNEDALKDAMEELRGQRDALNLLITVVQSHSIGEILEFLKAKRSAFEDVRRRTDSLYRRPQGDNGQILNDRWDSETYSIFSEYTERKFFDFDDDIMKSPAYKRIYSSVRSVRRPRRPQRTRLEPIVNLLEEEEDLIDLRDHPPLIVSYSVELQNELSTSGVDITTPIQPSATSPNITEDPSSGYIMPIESQSNQDRELDRAISGINAMEVTKISPNADYAAQDLMTQRPAEGPDEDEGGDAMRSLEDETLSTRGIDANVIQTGSDENEAEETKTDEPVSDVTTDDEFPANQTVEKGDAMKIDNPLLNTSRPIAAVDATPALGSEFATPATPSEISQKPTALHVLEPIILQETPSNFIKAAASGESYSVRKQLLRAHPIPSNVLQKALLSASLNGHIDIVEWLLLRGTDVNCKLIQEVMICNRLHRNLTPLHLAAANNKSPIIELLLKCGAKVGSEDSLDWTPLHFASARGCVSAVQALLKHKAPIEAQASPPFEVKSPSRMSYFEVDSCTPLFVAIIFGAVETAMILQDSGANTNVKGGLELTLLHAAALGNSKNYSEQFMERLSQDYGSNTVAKIILLSGPKLQSLSYIFLIEHLIKVGCDPAAPDAFGFTPLHLACLHNVDIARVLIKYTRNVSAKSRFGWTPLHIAALWSSDVQLAHLLIQAGADLEAPIETKCFQTSLYCDALPLTPLGLAVAKANHNMARFLLQMGAKAQMPDPLGYSVLHIVAAMGNTDMLVLLCKQGVGFKQKEQQDVKTAERPAAKQSPGPEPFFRRGLYKRLGPSAAIQSTEEIFASEEYLPKSLRVDVDVRDRNGNTPLLKVIGSFSGIHRMAVTTLLLRLGASAGVSDQNGRHLLHFSGGLTTAEIRALFEAGAPLEAKDSSGLTPLLWLVGFGHSLAHIRCLIDLGADIYAKDADGRSAWKLASERHKDGIGRRAISSISYRSLSELTDDNLRGDIRKILDKAKKM